MSQVPPVAAAEILIAEDELIIGEDIRQQVEELGHRVPAVVASGEDAVKAADAFRPDLVLMDIVLTGEMDGVEAAGIIREKHGIPVVFLTAYADARRVDRAKLAMPFAYLIKPFEQRNLGVTIEMALFAGDVERKRRRAEEDLIRYSRIASSTRDGISLVDRNYRYIIVNDAYETYSGRSRDEIVGLSVPEYLGRDVFEGEVKEQFHRCLAGETVRYQSWFDYPTLGRRFMDVTYTPYIGAYGDIEGVAAVSSDITDIKVAEDSHREAAELFRQIFENTTNGVAVYRPVDDGRDFEFVDINPAGRRLSELGDEPLKGRRVTEVFPGVEDLGLLEIFRQVHVDGRPRRLPLRLYQDRRIQQMVENMVFRLPSGLLVAVYEDTTDRNRMREALEESETRYRELVENANVIILQMDPRGRLIFLNRYGLDFFGYTEDEIIGRSVLETILPEDESSGRKLTDLPDRLADHPEEYAENENENVLKNGARVWISWRNKPLYDADGKLDSWLCFGVDVTAARRAKEDLELSEDKFSRVFHNDSILMTISSLEDGVYEDVNEAFARTTGFSRQEAVGTSSAALGFISVEDRESIRSEAQAKGRVEPRELELRTKNGRTLYCLFSAEIISYGGGDRLLSIAQDITRRRRAEDELRRSEAQYRALFENAGDAVFIDNLKGDILDANPRAEALLGYSREELQGMKVRDIVAPEALAEGRGDPKREAEMFSDRTFESMDVRKDGRYVPVEVSVSVVSEEGDGLVVDIVRDISDRKRVEAEARLSESRLSLIQDAAGAGGADVGKLAELAVENMVSFSGSEMGFLGFLDDSGELMTIHSWTKTAMKQCAVHRKPMQFPLAEAGLWSEPVRTGRPLIINDYRRPHPAKRGYPPGHVEIRRFMAVPVFDSGKLAGVAAVANRPAPYDETDARHFEILMETAWLQVQRKQAEFQQAESEERYRTVVESAPLSILVVQHGRYVFANAAAAEVHGYESAEAFMGRSAVETITPGSRKVIEARLARIEQGLPNEPVEIEIIRKDGSILPVETLSVPFKYNGRSAALIFGQDISGRKSAEKELRENLEEKNSLLREIHHRVRNNLQVLTSLTNLQERRETHPEALDVLRSTKSRLLAMARAHELLYRSDSLSAIDLKDYLQRLAANVRESYASAPEQLVVSVHADDGVAMNIDRALPCGLAVNELMTNAVKHAFPEHGRGEITIKAQRTGEGVRITVADNGRGVPAGRDYRDSESVGLPLVYGLVERQLQGEISLAADGGTLWTISFPL